MTRTVFDQALRAAALDAGAEDVEGRAGPPCGGERSLEGFRVGDAELRADFVIGADGATSHVADSAGLVDPSRVLWGFAVRCYFDQPVRLPVITLWEPKPWRAFAGYGWIFPGPDGVANAGLGLGTLSTARRARRRCASCRPISIIWSNSASSTGPPPHRRPAVWVVG